MVVYSAAKIGFISELTTRERAFLSCGLYIFANRPRSFRVSRRLHSEQRRHHSTLRTVFTTTPSSLVMKLRRKRELVGHFLRFPPRVLTPTRAIRAHQSVSVFRLHPFTDMSESPHPHLIRGEDFYSRTFTLRALPCFPLGSDRSAKQPTGEGKVKVRSPKPSPLIDSLTANCVTWVKA